MNFATILIYQFLTCICFVISGVVNRQCLKKCCSNDSILSSEIGQCAKANETVPTNYKNVCLVSSTNCKNKTVIPIPEEHIQILDNNTLVYDFEQRKVLLDPESYCIDFLDSVVNHTVLGCFDSPQSQNIKELGETTTCSLSDFCKSKVPFVVNIDNFTIIENSLKYSFFGQLTQFDEFCINPSARTALVCISVPKNDLAKLSPGDDCIRKCCPHDSLISNVTKNCVQLNQTVQLPYENVCRVTKKTCFGDKFPAEIPQESFTIAENYDLVYTYNEVSVIFAKDDYCLDFTNQMEFLSALVCVESNNPGNSAPIGMIISMPFLLLTFIAYALLPDRNLHMKALMFYVINLMFSYLLLVIIQLSESQFAEATCKSLGYFCLFFFLVSFFWMNVICIDIWWGFSGLRGFTGSKKTAERKRFLFYCAYAWGMPVLHVLVVFIIDILANQNSVLKPDIGNGQCFLRRGFPELLYFYGPMAILITINIVLFAITAIKIRRIKSETAMLKKEDSKRHSYENDRQIFNLYVKLLFAMGVNWSMEIISWAVIWAEEAPEAIWYLTDFCNAIYGVFIFFIFVFKRSIWKLLKKRYYTFIGKHHLAHSMTMTNTTRVTSYSTATSTIQETAHGGDNDTSTLKHDP